MKEKPKCKLLKKSKKGTYYYKCEPNGCEDECFVVVVWEFIERIQFDGTKIVIGERVKEVRCECMKFDRWAGSSDEDDGLCKLEMAPLEEEEIDGKKYRKTVMRCSKKLCSDECVVYIEYKDKDKELGDVKSSGCKCVIWSKL